MAHRNQRRASKSLLSACTDLALHIHNHERLKKDSYRQLCRFSLATDQQLSVYFSWTVPRTPKSWTRTVEIAWKHAQGAIDVVSTSPMMDLVLPLDQSCVTSAEHTQL
jgi:hypothetical protein